MIQTTTCGTKVEVEYTESVCGKCNGERFFHCYDHIANGVCFTCKGTGKIRVPVINAANAPKKAPVVADFTFQGRPGYIWRRPTHTAVEWNGGSISFGLDGKVIQWTLGIPRSLHAQIKALAGV